MPGSAQLQMSYPYLVPLRVPHHTSKTPQVYSLPLVHGSYLGFEALSCEGRVGFFEALLESQLFLSAVLTCVSCFNLLEPPCPIWG